MGFGLPTKDLQNVNYTNNVGWHLQEGAFVRDPVTYDHCTFGDIYGPSVQDPGIGFQYSEGGVHSGKPSMTNSLLYKIRSNGKALALSNWGKEKTITPSLATIQTTMPLLPAATRSSSAKIQA